MTQREPKQHVEACARLLRLRVGSGTHLPLELSNAPGGDLTQRVVLEHGLDLPERLAIALLRPLHEILLREIGR